MPASIEQNVPQKISTVYDREQRTFDLTKVFIDETSQHTTPSIVRIYDREQQQLDALRTQIRESIQPE